MFASGKTAAVASAANYIEDVFSTYLYTGNGSTQTITNGIDLSTYGGMIWTKDRNTARNNVVYDTTRGLSKRLVTNTTAAQTTATVFSTLTTTSYNADWPGTSANETNASGETYVSWTFRKQPKFFDVVTWTGDGNATKTISHNLGSTPGCIIVKLTSGVNGWDVYHRSLGTSAYVQLNTTAASTTISNVWGSITSTTFTATGTLGQNDSGATYVAYLFAHDAGGFGLTGTDNVISCGSFTTDGSGNATVSLGYEPQFIIDKPSSTTGNWDTFDVMRGWVADTNGTNQKLNPNLANAEVGSNYIFVNSTGFTVLGAAASTTYIYIAIRRGPMKVPTSGTSVFAPSLTTTNNTITTNFPVDLSIFRTDRAGTQPSLVFDRLRGQTQRLSTSSSGAEATATAYPLFDSNTGTPLTGFTAGLSGVDWAFRRAPSFFDEVCYTGTGSLRTVSHNLGAVPELLIVKRRDTAEDWNVYSATTGNAAYLRLNTTAAVGTAGADALWGSTTPTSSVFTVKTSGGTNASGGTFVAYLFATCAGVSKVGSYTGTGTTLQVNCGFTGGARFVLIKRTDSTGDWYVWDSARGIVAGNDPYLFWNSSAAEVTNTDYVDTYSAGFEISSTAPVGINASGGTYIFLAIA